MPTLVEDLYRETYPGGSFRPERRTPVEPAVPVPGATAPRGFRQPTGGGGGYPAPQAHMITPGTPEAASFRSPTPAPTSQGGSMALTRDPATGVEAIRGTGRPSWQVFRGAGEGEQYPHAVEAWKGEVAKEAGATERARMAAEAHVAGARESSQARIDPAHRALFDEQTLALKRQREAEDRGRLGTQFDQWYKSYVGGSVPKEGEVAYHQYNDARLWEQDHPGEGRARYKENLQIRDDEPLFTPTNLSAFQQRFPNVRVPTAQELEVLKQSPEAWRETVKHYGPYLRQMTMQTKQQIQTGVEQVQRGEGPTLPRTWFEPVAE